MLRNRLYYSIKPLVPLPIRFAVRRWLAVRKRHDVGGVWPIMPGSEVPPQGWPGWPEGKQFALVLTHDVEGQSGLDKIPRLMELESKLGFRSSFNLIPEGPYRPGAELLEKIKANGFELGVHDLYHDGKLFLTRAEFNRRARQINDYLQEWDAVGFRSGFMLHNLDWVHELNVQYDASTFDTDPFEPQPQGRHTIFPFWVPSNEQSRKQKAESGKGAEGPDTEESGKQKAENGEQKGESRNRNGYVELPYTLPQDSTLFLLLEERHPDIWFQKVDWIARHGGMVLLDTHPDYMDFDEHATRGHQYPASMYTRLLEYIRSRYSGAYWHALPREAATFCRKAALNPTPSTKMHTTAITSQAKQGMNVTIFGMGYVGCVTAACLAQAGHQVTGVEMDSTKAASINAGQSPITEPGLDDMVRELVDEGRLRAVCKAETLGDVSLVCVGTPSNDNGSLDLRQVQRVCEELGALLAQSNSYHVVNIRSTVVPGTVERVLLPLLEEKSGKKAGRDFGVCMNPEFLREATAVKDFYNPPFTVIGAIDQQSAAVVARLYAGLPGTVETVPIKVAETIKYACNCFHALKVSFANEIGSLCKSLDIDSWQVMEIFCKDTKLNLSPYYLKPGFAFGGSCLPKDLRALVHLAKQRDVDVPVLSSVLASNQLQIERGYDLIRRTGKKNVGVVGLSFKSGSDDLRESPTVALIERLIGKGYHVSIYDSDVSLPEIRGKNRQFIERTLPHIASLLKPSLEELMASSEVVTLCKKQPELDSLVAQANGKITVVDLVRAFRDSERKPTVYEGICW